MATIINTPSNGDHHDSDEGMGVGMIVGMIFAGLIVVILFYMYGWPALRGEPSPTPSNINITLPNPPAPTPAP